MARMPRVHSKTGYYHLITRGNNKKNLFCEPEDFEYYLKLLAQYSSLNGVQINHYCLMTNHTHLLVHSEEPRNISQMMHGLQRSYVLFFKKKYRWTGHLFQGRFKSLAIEKEVYLLECARYIERNPVRANLVKDPADWPHSSYHAYAFGNTVPYLTLSEAYLCLSTSPEQRQTLYRQYLNESRPYENLVDRSLAGALR